MFVAPKMLHPLDVFVQTIFAAIASEGSDLEVDISVSISSPEPPFTLDMDALLSELDEEDDSSWRFLGLFVRAASPTVGLPLAGLDSSCDVVPASVSSPPSSSSLPSPSSSSISSSCTSTSRAAVSSSWSTSSSSSSSSSSPSSPSSSSSSSSVVVLLLLGAVPRVFRCTLKFFGSEEWVAVAVDDLLALFSSASRAVVALPVATGSVGHELDVASDDGVAEGLPPGDRSVPFSESRRRKERST
uniref:Uncharacterized protein n=1 Tax=Anopheles coluzzii TaxID=1518534 RepID=A0A8W7PJU1_ANOCL